MSDTSSTGAGAHQTAQGSPAAVAIPEENMKRLAVLLQDCLGEADEDGVESVDCFFIEVPVAVEKAQARRAGFVALLDRWPTETGDGPVSPLGAGPGYIHVGAVLGSQQLALIMFAVGKTLGLWGLITPQSLGFEGDAAAEMAGLGLVMIDGYRPDGDTAG